MNEFLPFIVIIILIVALILWVMVIKRMAHEIDELKEKLEHHRIKLKQLDFYNLSEHEKRLDKLEEVLELKEYFDEEPLNEEENE